MNYELAETEIVTRLNTQIALNNVSGLYEAVLMPETDAEFKALNRNLTKARVAVQFVDSMPQSSNALDITSQEETVKFRLSFDARKLRGPGGLYAMFEIVKLVLIGYRLTDSMNRLNYVKYGLLEFEQNSFQPFLEFECKAVNVQSFSDNPADLPLSGGPVKVVFPPEVFAPEFNNEFQ